MMYVFKNQLKILLRDRIMIFWTLVFPLILATFFNLAFSNLTSNEEFKTINIGIVNNNSKEENKYFLTLVDDLGKNGTLNVTNFTSEKEANAGLDANNIVGYYLINDDIETVIKSNGIDQTMIKYIADNYKQNLSVINNVYKAGYSGDIISLLQNLNNDTNYFKEEKKENTDLTVIYFYSLIGMVCMYGAMFGCNAVTNTEANLSKKGARISIAPTNKFKVLLSSLLASFLIQYLFIIILFLYLIFILNIDFGNQTLLIMLLSLFGSLAGVSLGIFVGVCNKKNERVKTAILLTIIMSFSFLSGMMMIDIKYIIQNNIPLLAKINPVNLITDGLYSLYYYNGLNRYIENIIYLLLFTGVMFLASYFFLRRKKYDSI